jgi:hypothetical protein
MFGEILTEFCYRRPVVVLAGLLLALAPSSAFAASWVVWMDADFRAPGEPGSMTVSAPLADDRHVSLGACEMFVGRRMSAVAEGMHREWVARGLFIDSIRIEGREIYATTRNERFTGQVHARLVCRETPDRK